MRSTSVLAAVEAGGVVCGGVEKGCVDGWAGPRTYWMAGLCGVSGSPVSSCSPLGAAVS